MTLGELIDELNDRLKSGEFNRLDDVYVEGDEEDSDWYPLTEVIKHDGGCIGFYIEANIRGDCP